MSHVFISYSRKDSAFVHKLADALKHLGFEVWIDKQIEHGATWVRVIQEKIDTCDAFIVVMTPHSFKSDWVLNELTRAQEKKKPIFPLLLEGDEPWISVQTLQYVDVRNKPWPPLDFYQRLEQAVLREKEQRGEPATTIFLPQIHQGKDVLSLITNSNAFHSDHDEIQDEMEARLVGDFLQSFENAREINAWGESGDMVEVAFRFAKKIEELKKAGFFVYGGITTGKFNTQFGMVENWKVAILIVTKRDVQHVIFRHDPGL